MEWCEVTVKIEDKDFEDESMISEYHQSFGNNLSTMMMEEGSFIGNSETNDIQRRFQYLDDENEELQ